MLPPLPVEQVITKTIKEEWGRLLAYLVRSFGDLQLAEDVLQEAVEVALVRWKSDGLPTNPAAWLMQTARRKAIDRHRRDQLFKTLTPQLSHWLDLQRDDQNTTAADTIPDKRLELIFTCCHPALEQKTRVALTLRTLGGLTTDEIANAFLDTTPAMAQRLVRAKKKIALAKIPYRIPDTDVLAERQSAVLSVIYFIFNEGYTASSGERVIRADLCDEAIRLGRITLGLLPEHTEVAGLLSLMLLHDSRRYARLDKAGNIIALEQQNRALWDKGKISLGTSLLKKTLPKHQVGPYQLQAAISAVHSEALTWSATDWPQIVALYELLHSMQPSAVVRINQAVAIAYSGDNSAALKVLDEVYTDPDIHSYQHYYAARAEVLVRTGRNEEARGQLQSAIQLTNNCAEKRFLSNRLNQL